MAMMESVPAPVGVAAASRGQTWSGGQTWSRKLVVGGAFLVGLLTGGMGLAAAGALPRPAQNVAHEALHAVGVDVPKPHQARSTDGCDGANVKNHGQFVRSQTTEDRAAAAQSNCGKPESSVTPGPSTSPAAKAKTNDDKSADIEKGDDKGADVEKGDDTSTTDVKDDSDKATEDQSHGKSGDASDHQSPASPDTTVHGNGNGNNGNGNGNGGGNGNGNGNGGGAQAPGEGD